MRARQLVSQALGPLNSLEATIVHDRPNEFKPDRLPTGPLLTQKLAWSLTAPYHNFPDDIATEDALSLTAQVLPPIVRVANLRRPIHTGGILAHVEDSMESRMEHARQTRDPTVWIRALAPLAAWRGGAAQEADIQAFGMPFYEDVMEDDCLKDGDTDVLLTWANSARIELQKAVKNLPLPRSWSECQMEDAMQNLSLHKVWLYKEYISGGRLAAVVKEWGDTALKEGDVEKWVASRFALVKLHQSLALRKLFPYRNDDHEAIVRFEKLCNKFINFPSKYDSNQEDGLWSVVAKKAESLAGPKWHADLLIPEYLRFLSEYSRVIGVLAIRVSDDTHRVLGGVIFLRPTCAITDLFLLQREVTGHWEEAQRKLCESICQHLSAVIANMQGGGGRCSVSNDDRLALYEMRLGDHEDSLYALPTIPLRPDAMGSRDLFRLIDQRLRTHGL